MLILTLFCIADDEENWSLILYTNTDSQDSLTTNVFFQMNGHLGQSNIIMFKNNNTLKSGSARKFNFSLENNNIGNLEVIEISISNIESDSFNWHLHKVNIKFYHII